uniref:PiggyBac transposable element-derived protein domain-containing protein n=1 Tax=Sinocyclocheilus anshuiensis TaxID=1608454 RepID=A0A671KYI7_9TELE
VWEPVSKKPYTKGHDDNTSSGEDPHPSPSQRDSAKGEGELAAAAVKLRCQPAHLKRWNGVDVPEVTPPQPTFRPTKSPGPQLIRTANYTVLQLFQLVFTNSMLLTIIKTTNDFHSNNSKPSDLWIDVTLQDMFAFMAMVIYMGLVKLPAITDYWRGGKLYSLLFPKKLFAGKKFLRICHSHHLSSLVDDAARIGIKQYMKNKPVRWGYKLFVLADSSNGYTWNFFVYEGKLQGNSGKGLSYESVMELVDTWLLGTGYKLFFNNFYTTRPLFCDLFQKRIWACGTDSLLFVQVDADGHWVLKNISVPPAVKECMGGVDLSDALINYYKVIHKTQKWYKTFFYHFLDIAVVNTFLLYKSITKGKGEVLMHQRAFRETLVEELAAAAGRPAPSTTGHLRCRHCQAQTPVKSDSCDVPLCFVPNRDCYNDWHDTNIYIHIYHASVRDTERGFHVSSS